MLFFGEMHLLTALFIVLELMMLSVQLFFYLMWPSDRHRLAYLVLLVLLVFFNVTAFFPDPDIGWISVKLQNIISYGTGFLLGAYFPYYFYVSFDLPALRFHVRYGVWFFLMLPYLLCFGIFYPLWGDLQLAVRLGMAVPAVYAPVLWYAIFRALRSRFGGADQAGLPYKKMAVCSVFLAVSPWVLMPLLPVLKAVQWVQTLFSNTGFLMIAVLFLRDSPRQERACREKLMELEARLCSRKEGFEKACQGYGLSERETEVSQLLCQGLTYKAIADVLHISARTVDTHAQNIFLKTGVNKKIDLQNKLGSAD